MPNTKASTSLHVSLLRNSWWSSGLNILLDGRAYVCLSRFGGSVNKGVGGGGADGGSRDVGARLRGMSLGSLALRSCGGDGIAGDCVCVIMSCTVCVGCLGVECVGCSGSGTHGKWRKRPVAPGTSFATFTKHLRYTKLIYLSLWHIKGTGGPPRTRWHHPSIPHSRKLSIHAKCSYSLARTIDPSHRIFNPSPRHYRYPQLRKSSHECWRTRAPSGERERLRRTNLLDRV
jgi:hypothetical protein